MSGDGLNSKSHRQPWYPSRRPVHLEWMAVICQSVYQKKGFQETKMAMLNSMYPVCFSINTG